MKFLRAERSGGGEMTKGRWAEGSRAAFPDHRRASLGMVLPFHAMACVGAALAVVATAVPEPMPAGLPALALAIALGGLAGLGETGRRASPAERSPAMPGGGREGEPLARGLATY
jgi:hypothetical protein